MKILLICNTTGSIITFRKSLIEKLQSEGYEIAAIAFDDINEEIIKNMKVDFYKVDDANRSMNPFKVLTLKKKYVSIIKNIHPDIVFTFMLKPNIFGVRAARKAGIEKIFSMVEGAGDVFINKGLKWKFIRNLVCKFYRKSFRYSKKVFFLNQDDRAEFLSRKLVKEEQCEIICGIGVNIDYFSIKPVKNQCTFLMIARMLRTKGVIEYCEAARITKLKYPNAVFNYLGAEGNIKVCDIQHYIDDGIINYLGTTKDVRPFLEECTAYILPSYREGLPVSVMEAEATGRMIIATDVPGCRDTVINGYNGFLVECGNPEALAEKIIWCIENYEDSKLCGINSRKLAEEKYDTKKINERIKEVIELA